MNLLINQGRQGFSYFFKKVRPVLHSKDDTFSDHEHVSATFLRNLNEGRVCVHPTDTIPGLTCSPVDTNAIQHLVQIKRRTQKKAMVGLVSSFEQAKKFWQPLPDLWQELIPLLWPGPITIVWKSRVGLPSCLVSESGEVALREPLLAKEDLWLMRVLKTLTNPLPSTSINYEQEAPLKSEEELAQFCEHHDIFHAPVSAKSHGTPSSVLRIIGEESFEWLRKGALSEDTFDVLYSRIKVKHIHA